MSLVRSFYEISKSVCISSLTKPWQRKCQIVKPVYIARHTSTTKPLSEKKEVKVTFIKAGGKRIEAKGKVGDSLLDIVVNNELDFDGFGACEGTLTCSTCHCIFKQEDYDKLPEKPTDDEMDMLDLAYELTDTSRLGCQIIMSEELDGLEVRLPTSINDARS
ncbi:hypothetical protein QAD02_004756 [Eretmocerus hayati]|uniref:Uncharacterized protein n=1 Tax=Eretmocerus hayati TaxID=131215 RepID=A0ACC2NQF2_9HYME|nr:hypothetical protein QAD02_004756 [Eretmocerus hayati]